MRKKIPKFVLLTSLLPLLSTEGSMVLEQKVNERATLNFELDNNSGTNLAHTGFYV